MPDQEQTGQDSAVTPATSGPTARGALRVSHEDRDQVAEALRVAAGDGRLTSDELDERLEKALTARTYDDLAPLLADLPPAQAALAPLSGPIAAVMAGGVAPPPAKELIRIDTTSGQIKKDGRWAVPARMEVRTRSGQITLDFTEATVTQPELHLDLDVRSGQVLLLTRPGIAVDFDDVSLRSGQTKVRAPWGDSVPVFLRITVTGSCRSGQITARPPRRSFWEWLRRAPRRYAIAA
jgi:hypothetical protein